MKILNYEHHQNQMHSKSIGKVFDCHNWTRCKILVGFCYCSNNLSQLLVVSFLLLFGPVMATATTTTGTYSSDNCPTVFDEHCQCGIRPYGLITTGRPTFITNCTNANFTDPTLFTHIPPETEVLIFTGNNFTELPANLLDQNKKYDKLFLVDLSSNHIESIHGKAFHNMRSVQILLLNNNSLRITTDDAFHPRVFASLKNLEELHLNQAFEGQRFSQQVAPSSPKLAQSNKDQYSVALVSSLAQSFNRSQLTSLKVLNLEHNGITVLNQTNFFCSLPELQRISLAYNELSDYQLNGSCLPLLNYVDVSNNLINTLSNRSIALIRSGPANYHLNISENPFRCDCKLFDFFRFVRNVSSAFSADMVAPKLEWNERFRCLSSPQMDIAGKYFDDLTEKDFDCLSVNSEEDDEPTMSIVFNTSKLTESQKSQALHRYRYYITLSYLVLGFLLSLLLFLVGVLVYTNREFIQTSWNFFLVEVSAKREYTALDKDMPSSSSSNTTASNTNGNSSLLNSLKRSTGVRKGPKSNRTHIRMNDDPNVAEVQV